jgi:hypothetical protein
MDTDTSAVEIIQQTFFEQRGGCRVKQLDDRNALLADNAERS